MDARLWGGLQYHIPLEKIYERLPFSDFFGLRVVCKDWNRLACERRCFSDVIPKPYFVALSGGNGSILTYSIACGRWSWKRVASNLAEWSSSYPPFAIEGMIFCATPNYRRVFNVHTKVWHEIPKAPASGQGTRAFGMTVDTSVRPYTFKLILGFTDLATQVYDSTSRTWETKTSRLHKLCRGNTVNTGGSCLYISGCFYMLTRHFILAYSLVKDRWGALRPPIQLKKGTVWRGLGAWQGRLYTVISDPLTIWKLVDRSKQLWKEYDRIPTELYRWLNDANNVPDLSLSDASNVSDPLSCMPPDIYFCGGYLLASPCRWLIRNDQVNKLVLYNIETKNWECVSCH